MRTRWSPQQGSALVIVLPLILILTLLGSISLQNTLQEVRRVSQERNGLQVFYLAEAGAERARQVLAATGDSPTSWDLDGWDADSWTDELLGQDGRPNTADDGILYFGPVVLFNGGEYRVKIVDNDDSDGNLFKDVDDTVKIISVGKVTAVNPVNTTTTTTKEATIEMLVHRFRVKHLGAVYLAGSKGGAEFSGDTFLLSGDDHKLDWSVNPLNLAAVPGIATNGSLSKIDLDNSQKDNVQGKGFKLSPLTASLLSTQETAEVQGLADIYTARADNVVAPGTYASGWGSPSQYQVTVVNGNLTLTGGAPGYGVLVVKGNLTLWGRDAEASWVGLVICLNKVTVNGEIFPAGVLGSVYVLTSSGDDLDVRGNARIYYGRDVLQTIASQFNTVVVSSWEKGN